MNIDGLIVKISNGARITRVVRLTDDRVIVNLLTHDGKEYRASVRFEEYLGATEQNGSSKQSITH